MRRPPPAVTTVSDLAALAGGFSEALRRAGVAATTEQAGRFAHAVVVTSPSELTDLYWVARATLVTSHDQIPTFDAVFRHVFGGVADHAEFRGEQGTSPLPPPRPPDPTGRPRSPRAPSESKRAVASSPSASDSEGVDNDGREVTISTASREERLAQRNFAELEADDLAELRRLLHSIHLALPLRPGRRARRHRRGDAVDLRATLRRSHRSAGDALRLVRRSPRRIPRRLVVICDISGSMEPYALAYVHFLHAAASVSGSARAEVFTFATRLSRLTKALSDRDIQTALRRAAAAAPDWQGGTRIGEAVKTFLDSYGRRGMARGAVVVLMSDGWERDDPGMLGEQMARLRRLAYRIVWVNPRSADPRYEPLTGGMAAALPHCDVLVSGHSVAALEHLATAVAASR
jgi:uncharacterized protein with von Willebrand factor type A (vWA) domain